MQLPTLRAAQKLAQRLPSHWDIAKQQFFKVGKPFAAHPTDIFWVHRPTLMLKRGEFALHIGEPSFQPFNPYSLRPKNASG